LCEPLFLFCK